jgi:hypothetical protein
VIAGVAVALVFTVPVVVALVVVVPVVVVLDAAVLAFPIAAVEALTVVTRAYPTSALVGRASPVAAMPTIVAAYGIPVAFDPEELGAGADRANGNDPRRGRGTDYDSDRNLSERCGRSGPKHCKKQYCSDEFPHVLPSPLVEVTGHSDYPELEARCIGEAVFVQEQESETRNWKDEEKRDFITHTDRA